jgi:hypothetical protein
MKDTNNDNTHPAPKPKSGKVPVSDMVIGPARGGPMDSLLMQTQGKTLKQWVGELHGWVKE